jgi:ribosomal protein S18 acetylase RimI-like enzyme
MQIHVHVVQTDEADDNFAHQVSRLASQLRGEPSVVTAAWLRELLAFPKTWMIVTILEAETEAEIVGMLTLHAFPRVRGWTAWIEGVVVEETMRGRGIGRMLLRQAIAVAEEQGYETINLSSRPSRETANRLYASLGFEVVPTNYRRKQL